jgi:hypothetical protein
MVRERGIRREREEEEEIERGGSPLLHLLTGLTWGPGRMKIS